MRKGRLGVGPRPPPMRANTSARYMLGRIGDHSPPMFFIAGHAGTGRARSRAFVMSLRSPRLLCLVVACHSRDDRLHLVLRLFPQVYVIRHGRSREVGGGDQPRWSLFLLTSERSLQRSRVIGLQKGGSVFSTGLHYYPLDLNELVSHIPSLFGEGCCIKANSSSGSRDGLPFAHAWYEISTSNA